MAGRDGPVKWIDRLKVALIEEDEKKIAELLDHMPSFKERAEIEEAMKLLEHGIALFSQKRDETAKEMRKIADAKKFLTSTEDKEAYHRLDITS